MVPISPRCGKKVQARPENDNIFFLGPCPEGWIDGSSVNMGCLFFEIEKFMYWHEAQKFCGTMHESYLVEIFDSNQQKFIR